MRIRPVCPSRTTADAFSTLPLHRLAGYETSSTALTWTLHLLASNPEAQDKLRAELLAVPEAEPSIDVLNGLPYLDAVVKESLRIESPVSGTVRMAAEDEVIPLSVPVVGRDGKEMTSVNVSKGTAIFVGSSVPLLPVVPLPSLSVSKG